jgi:cytochrome c peroxidase
VLRGKRPALLTWRLCALLGALLGAVLALQARAAPALLDFSAEEIARIKSHGPWPMAAERDASNRVDGRPAARDFGRLLFFSPHLSRSGTLACAGCHQPQRAFQDGLAVAAGGGTRNTPSLLDVAGRRWLGWGGAHDSLWSASLAPLLARSEMAQTAQALAARVRSTPAWAAAYQRSFGHAPGSDDEQVVVDVAKALAAYQATLQSPRTPFDDFRDALARGDRAAAARYPLAAQRGLRLFIGHGRCQLCHAGPAFSNGEFADIGIPFFVSGGVDSGRHAGLQALLASRYNRLGAFNDAAGSDTRALLTQQLLVEHRHFGEFRVPGLRQLAHSAPYMHDGSLPTLDAVVRHYSELNEERLHADGERILRPLALTAAQAADLEAFLRSLSAR